MPTAPPATASASMARPSWPASTSGPASPTCPVGTADWTFTDVTGNYNDTSGSVAIVITKANADCDSISGTTVTYDGNAHGASGDCFGVDGTTVLAGLDLGASFTDVPGGTADWTFTDVTGNYNDDLGLGRHRHHQGRRRPALDRAATRSPMTAMPTAPPATASASMADDPGRPRPRGQLHRRARRHGRLDVHRRDQLQRRPRARRHRHHQADADCSIGGNTVTYDGNAHGATGDCFGVDGTTAGRPRPRGQLHRRARWHRRLDVHRRDGNYNDDPGSVAIVITKADADLLDQRLHRHL